MLSRDADHFLTRLRRTAIIMIAVIFLSNFGSLDAYAAGTADSDYTPVLKSSSQKFTVIYHANNGTDETNISESYSYGASVTAKPADTYSKPTVLTFLEGWSLTAYGPVAYKAGEVFVMPGKNINLYAVWNTNVVFELYYVIYHANNGTAEADIMTEGYLNESNVKAKPGSIFTAPAGKVFAGWGMTGCSVTYKAGQGFSMPVTTLNLYAVWAKIPYSMVFSATYHANNNTSEEDIIDSDFTAGEKVTARSIGTYTAPAGREFAGWSLTDDGPVEYYSGEIFLMYPYDIDLYAVWSNKPVLNRGDHNAYILGYPDGTFKSLRNITRAEAVVIFSRLLTNKIEMDVEYTSTYTDVLPGKWYANAIGYMQQHNVLSGTEKSFRPDEPITRAEYADLAVSFEDIKTGGTNSFTDVPSYYWAYDSINYAVDRGWLTGYPDDSFRPDNYITRDEVVTVTNRVLKRYADPVFIDTHTVEIKKYTDIDTVYWAYGNIMEASIGHKYIKIGTNETWTTIN